MATIFSCEHCGGLLTTEERPGRVVVCRRCHGRTEVPAGLAGLPAPQVAGDSPPAPVEQDFSPDQPDAACNERESMRKIAAAMPWVISAMAHVAVGLALMLLVCIVIDPADGGPPPKPALAIDNTSNPPIEMQQLTGSDTEVLTPNRQRDRGEIDRPRLGQREQDYPVDFMIGMVGQLPHGDDDGFKIGGRDGPGPGPRGILGPPGGAANIVYVVDRSGSMHKTFGIVREDMISSIVRLIADEPGEPADDCIDQWFHVILFADGEPIEHDAKRLVPATADNKASACTFLQDVHPGGQTDPVPALERAFTVLGRAADPSQGTVMFLLTDGDFPDNQEVLDIIAKLNRNESVMINTILFGRRTAEAERVMDQIATQNGGRYKFVSLDEIQGDIR